MGPYSRARVKQSTTQEVTLMSQLSEKKGRKEISSTTAAKYSWLIFTIIRQVQH